MKSKAKQPSLDRISTLPENIAENILCLVPIKDAVRTSILSKSWRHSWTRIPKLVFNVRDMFDQLNEDRTTKRNHVTGMHKFFCAINQVLLMHQFPILEFTLAKNGAKTCAGIDQIITYLSRKNTVKKFTPSLTGYITYKLPSSFFSLHQLTDLYLCSCDFYPNREFSGFRSLTSLYMKDVATDTSTLMRLLSKNPLLKSFGLITTDNREHFNYELFNFEYVLFNCLPMIEHLSLTVRILEFDEDGVLPTELVHLKYLLLHNVRIAEDHTLPLIAHMIESSPNLEKLVLQMFPVDEDWFDKSEVYYIFKGFLEEDCLEHLNELEITNVAYVKPEVDVVKLILAESPMLKKVSLVLMPWVTKDEELELLRDLLCSPRASLIVKIYVERPPE